MGYFYTVTKTPVVTKSRGVRSSNGTVTYTVKLTWLGTILLFPVWILPYLLLLFLKAAVFVARKVRRY